jgi:hypothetical protein
VSCAMRRLTVQMTMSPRVRRHMVVFLRPHNE